MDTAAFSLIVEEIAKEHLEDALATKFFQICNETFINEWECIFYTGKIALQFASKGYIPKLFGECSHKTIANKKF